MRIIVRNNYVRSLRQLTAIPLQRLSLNIHEQIPECLTNCSAKIVSLNICKCIAAVYSSFAVAGRNIHEKSYNWMIVLKSGRADEGSRNDGRSCLCLCAKGANVLMNIENNAKITAV